MCSTDSCPENYEEGPNGHCYWFGYGYEYGYVWYYGRLYCMDEPDSDLVIIDDEEELAFLQNRIAEINETSRDWWIGKNFATFLVLFIKMSYYAVILM